MLVLTCETDERIVISSPKGATGVVTVVALGNDRLGFEAPREVEIDREAIYLKKHPKGVALQGGESGDRLPGGVTRVARMQGCPEPLHPHQRPAT